MYCRLFLTGSIIKQGEYNGQGGIEEIGKYLKQSRYVITDHARREMQNDDVSVDDIVSACIDGEIIEDYPSAYPLPACLILGDTLDGRPLHVCLSKPPLVKIITVYVPTPTKWESDWKTRKVVS
ncbi:DUF4258 domain-containing protein [Candidatus Poribacteria bacterium]|nr:DUF4258 domain-containing protein [Candidatus Poribacteria bacterium]